ncbi:Elongation of fatty acids protein 2, variant 2 [Mucor circinelloides]
MDEATELGNQEDINRFSKRTVKVTTQHNDECKELLRVMGIPYVEAPCEAEAQCAELAKSGKVFAAASEDMDTLTFGTPVLLRHLTFSEARKMPIDEVNLEKALEGLDLTMAEFIDLCILMGCDYTETIKGVGPKNAYNLIKQHKTIDEAIKHLTPRLQDNIPAGWNYADARRLFVESEVTPGKDIELSWNTPDVEAVVDLMVRRKGFAEDRIRNGCAKLEKNLKQATQTRVQDFFKVLPSAGTSKAAPKDDKKRGAKDAGKKAPAKRGRRK